LAARSSSSQSRKPLVTTSSGWSARRTVTVPAATSAVTTRARGPLASPSIENRPPAALSSQNA
jgi:hypothetical protein